MATEKPECAEREEAAAPGQERWDAFSGVSCQLSVALTITGFKVRDLLELAPEAIVETGNSATGPAPVWVNGVKIAWAEFDVLRTRLAIRISELE